MMNKNITLLIQIHLNELHEVWIVMKPQTLPLTLSTLHEDSQKNKPISYNQPPIKA